MENIQPVKPFVRIRIDKPITHRNGVIRPFFEKKPSYTGTIIAVHLGCKLSVGRRIVVPVNMLRPVPNEALDMLVDVSDNKGIMPEDHNYENKHWVLLA